ncbi:cytochrome P450 [Neptunitalea chrysea]|uniref:Cytochrome P450 n=1 Tax=Neptunitalea chrysea TaxID=1647581 RepID=A0A9W6ETG2_9FLAO|nr:cytochrome P450 [Neptunitalea chrysea]GLB51004.1 cytochrome P450 [Neptunitalea chrysea]
MSLQTNIPTVSTFRFLRNAAQILKNPLPFHRANFKRLGDTFRLKIGAKTSLLFSRDAGLAQYVLQKNQKNYYKSSIQTEDLAKYVGLGLLTTNGEHWRKQRKLIQPAFHKKHLTRLLDTVEKAIISEIERITVTEPIDIFPILNDLAFQTVVKALFSGAADANDIAELQEITETAQKMLVSELRQPYKAWWFKLTGKIERNIAYTHQARTILKQIVDERRKAEERFGDLLDMLLEATYDDGSVMEEEQLIDEILILFIAGHETTSNALTFFCELMARHPEVQEKLAVEVQQNTSLDIMTRIQESVYANAVIAEVMRLYPPVYFIDRVCLEDDAYNGMLIAKGTSILMSVYEIHRSVDFWDDPLTFKPERFEDATVQNTMAYYPFGAGPRKCIGNNFAMFEMILAMSELLKRFRIETKNTPIEILPLITLKPKNAILQFKTR